MSSSDLNLTKEFRLDWSAKIKLFAILSSIFLAAMDQTVVSTALPTIARDLNGLTQLPWIITAYLLTSTIVLPVYGKLGDLLGRKYVLQFAIILFLIGSALSGLAQNVYELIAFRALQGLGGGGLLVTAIASISDFIPVTQRSKYQGLVGSVFGLATLIGPFLGGFMVEVLSWRWVFYVNVPFGIIALLVVGLTFSKPKPSEKWLMDIWGTAFLSLGLSALVIFASVINSVLPVDSPYVWAIFSFSLLCFVGFYFSERKHSHPLLPLGFFKFRSFSLSVILSFFVGLAMLGSISFLPIYLQDVRGFSPTEAGLELLYLLGGMLIMSTVSGRYIAKRQKYKNFPIVGLFLISLALGLLSRLSETIPMGYIDGFLILLGIGIGMTMQVLILSAQLSVPHKHLGVATSTASLFRSMGGTLGVAGFGAVFSGLMESSRFAQEHSSEIVEALHQDFAIAALVSALAFFGTWFLEDMSELLSKKTES